MTKLERLEATVSRKPTDRPPYAFWRHFPDIDRSPAALAQSTLRFHERYGSDFLKVTPPTGYAVEDWGCVAGDAVMPDGHRPCARHGVTDPADWRKIRPLKMESTGWAAQLETLIRCVVDRRADGPTLSTVSSPLSLARMLAGDRLSYDLKENPGVVTDALEAIAETILAFAAACAREGVDGVFYSVDAPGGDVHTEEEYLRFGEPHDRRILEAVRPACRLIVLHGHGGRSTFDHVSALPADAWSWDEREGGPTLEEGKARVRGAVIGGLRQATLKEGPPEAAKAEAQDAIARTGGTGLILGVGGLLASNTSDLTLVELIRSIGGQPTLGLLKPQ